MINEYSSQIISTTEDFFKAMAFKIEKIGVINQGGTFLISIRIEDPKILIGERGQTLLEIQHILRIVVRKKIKNDLLIELDINNYKEKKKAILSEVANDIADEVLFYKKEKILPPMNAYERRIIHLALSNRNNIQTESSGEGLDRRIIVKFQEDRKGCHPERSEESW